MWAPRYSIRRMPAYPPKQKEQNKTGIFSIIIGRECLNFKIS